MTTFRAHYLDRYTTQTVIRRPTEIDRIKCTGKPPTAITRAREIGGDGGPNRQVPCGEGGKPIIKNPGAHPLLVTHWGDRMMRAGEDGEVGGDRKGVRVYVPR